MDVFGAIAILMIIHIIINLFMILFLLLLMPFFVVYTLKNKFDLKFLKNIYTRWLLEPEGGKYE